VSLGKLIRNSVAGFMIAALPVTSAFAATRPSAAVPAAGSSAVTAQYDNDGGKFIGAWPAYAIIILAILIAIWIAADGDNDGEGDFSPG